MTDHPTARPPLDRGRLADGLAHTRWRVEVVAEAASTNALVADRARAGDAEGLVVVAEHQTAGRGRLDRVWETPDRAALTFSVLLRPTVEAAEWPWLPLLSGYAVARGLAALGVDAGLKWPNDVLLGDGKVGGLLSERIDSAAVVGIGLNVSTTREELPVAIATSLALAGHEVDRTDLLLAVLHALEEEYDAWQGGDRDRLHAAYRRSCVTLGRAVRVDLPTGDTVRGTATDVDTGGRLVVDTGVETVAVGAGDVLHAGIAP